MSALKIEPQPKMQIFQLTKSERASCEWMKILMKVTDAFCSTTSTFGVDWRVDENRGSLKELEI